MGLIFRFKVHNDVKDRKNKLVFYWTLETLQRMVEEHAWQLWQRRKTSSVDLKMNLKFTGNIWKNIPVKCQN